MTRTMALDGRLTGRARDAVRPGADEKPSRDRKALTYPVAEDIGPVTFSVLTGLIGPVVGAMKGDLPALRALAQAHAGNSRAALIQAARSRLLVLGREPLTYSPVVAATASRLRRLFPAGRHPAMGLLSP